MGNVRFRLGFVSFEIRWWIACIVLLSAGLAGWFAEALIIPLAYLSLALHEVGHAIVQHRIFGVPSRVWLYGIMRGATTSLLPRPATRTERVVYSLVGPLVGIVFGLVVALVASRGTFVVGGFAIAAMHAYNLLPFGYDSDGAHIKSALER